jgi:hypothetical protein
MDLYGMYFKPLLNHCSVHLAIVVLLPLHERAMITSLLRFCICGKEPRLLHCCVITLELLVVELLHSLLQFMIFLTRFSNKKIPKSDRHKKNPPC